MFKELFKDKNFKHWLINFFAILLGWLINYITSINWYISIIFLIPIASFYNFLLKLTSEYLPTNNFETEISGDWIEIFVNVKKIETFSICKIIYDRDENKISFGGKTYDRKFNNIGHWESMMTQIDYSNRILKYMFTGSFSKDEMGDDNNEVINRGIIEYLRPGFGEFRFSRKSNSLYCNADGKFWDESKSAQMEVLMVRLTKDIYEILKHMNDYDFAEKLLSEINKSIFDFESYNRN